MVSDSKNSRINNILSLVKLGSIIIISIIYLKNSTMDILMFTSFYVTIHFVFKLFLVIMLTTIYYLWSSVFIRKINKNYTKIIQIIESIALLILFMAFVWLTGKNQCPHKIIFIFIIIPVSIQFEFKYGFITALLSSLYLVILD